MELSLESSRSSAISYRISAIVAGLGLLAMAILAPIANFGILQRLVVPGDISTTANNIIASSGLFRVGICLFLIVAILDLIVAWALYETLKPVNRSLSLLAAWFRIAYAAIFVSALVNLLVVLQLLNGSDYLRGFEPNQLQAQVMVSLTAFTDGWNVGLTIFGLHLVVVGFLVFKSGFLPKYLGILVVIAGIGYLVDNFGKLLSPGYSLTIAMYTFIGEVFLIFWLLWRGIRGRDPNLN